MRDIDELCDYVFLLKGDKVYYPPDGLQEDLEKFLKDYPDARYKFGVNDSYITAMFVVSGFPREERLKLVQAVRDMVAWNPEIRVVFDETVSFTDWNEHVYKAHRLQKADY
jgi:hypothetical protein